jgi:murein DD-endopeptidase MepM/ murein hydrolase activator NlpD
LQGFDEPSNRLSEKLLRFFPERQVYFRSNGIVRFVQLSSTVQMFVAVLLLIALGWVGFTSVNFLIRDYVLEAREQTITDMAAAQDSLNQDILSLQDEVVSRADRLERRQQYLNNLMAEEPLGGFEAASNTSASKVVGPSAEEAATSAVDGEENADIEKGAYVAPARELSLFSLLMPSAEAAALPSVTPMDKFRPALLQRLALIEVEQNELAEKLTRYAQAELSDIDSRIDATGLKSTDLVAHWSGRSADTATGGPFIPGASLATLTATDAQNAILVALDDRWSDMQKARDAIYSIPVTIPAKKYYISSRYGRRLDPFKRARAMHYGLDMAGWPGNAIMTAADGVVTKAGTWGAYGNLIEIDHGNGFKTRYGHLGRIRVKRGDTLEAGQRIADMGCSGRCTSTHLHFEVWFAGKPQNPLPFIKVADNVFEIQRQKSEPTNH